MKPIHAQTRISELIKAHPDTVEAIAAINPHFKKLRNPIMRKLLAARVTLSEAARIGGCSLEDLYQALRPLGFAPAANEPAPAAKEAAGQPVAMPVAAAAHDRELDVRADIASGQDPFKKIMNALKELEAGQTLLLVNSFEPAPLIRILEGKGYEARLQHLDTNLVHTWLRKPLSEQQAPSPPEAGRQAFMEVLEAYAGRLQTVDVRALPMPQPMMTILARLEHLPPGMALFVHHKKIPVYLLPELQDRNFSWAYQQNGPDNVELIIYRNN